MHNPNAAVTKELLIRVFGKVGIYSAFTMSFKHLRYSLRFRHTCTTLMSLLPTSCLSIYLAKQRFIVCSRQEMLSTITYYLTPQEYFLNLCFLFVPSQEIALLQGKRLRVDGVSILPPYTFVDGNGNTLRIFRDADKIVSAIFPPITQCT